MQFQLVDVFTSTPYRGKQPDRLSRRRRPQQHPDGVDHGRAAPVRVHLLNPAGPQHHWRAHIFDLFEELDFAGHPVIGAAAVFHHRHGGDAVHGRWTMELASGALTVETERRGPAGFHAVLPEMAANFLGEPPDILPRAGGVVVLVAQRRPRRSTAP